jgi:hypothetical protein
MNLANREEFRKGKQEEPHRLEVTLCEGVV